MDRSSQNNKYQIGELSTFEAIGEDFYNEIGKSLQNIWCGHTNDSYAPHECPGNECCFYIVPESSQTKPYIYMEQPNVYDKLQKYRIARVNEDFGLFITVSSHELLEKIQEKFHLHEAYKRGTPEDIIKAEQYNLCLDYFNILGIFRDKVFTHGMKPVGHNYSTSTFMRIWDAHKMCAKQFGYDTEVAEQAIDFDKLYDSVNGHSALMMMLEVILNIGTIWVKNFTKTQMKKFMNVVEPRIKEILEEQEGTRDVQYILDNFMVFEKIIKKEK